MRHSWTAGAALAIALAATGCSASGGSSAPKAVPMSLEQLAKKTGCSVQVQTNATELRQGSCQTKIGRYVVLTFASDQGSAAWLTDARDYGGTYLIGSRWIIVGTQEQLAGFQGKIGGVIQAGAVHDHS